MILTLKKKYCTFMKMIKPELRLAVDDVREWVLDNKLSFLLLLLSPPVTLSSPLEKIIMCKMM